MIGGWILGLALLASVGVPGASGQESNDRHAGRQERREEAFRMVDAYIIANIQESLGLGEETYAKVVPIVNRLQKARREYYQERSQKLREMHRLLRSGTATEAQVRDELKALKALEMQGPERIRAQMEELDALLTPLQQAKYRVFEVEVEHRLRELMRRGRRSPTPSPE